MPGPDPESFYQRFSLEVGVRDWVVPNARHEQLKLFVGAALDGVRGLRILDVGCGAGVMTDALTPYGQVTGTDFSVPAISLARVMVPAADFHAGPLDQLPAQETFDLVTLFDVVEHVPVHARAAFFDDLRKRVRPGGRLLMSSPHPAFTRWLHEERPELLQVVDEPVDLVDLIALGRGLGLELGRYETFDVELSGPQYQLAEFVSPGSAGGGAARSRSLERRLRVHANPAARVLRRARLGLRISRVGRRREAAWFVLGRGGPLAKIGEAD